MALVTDIKNQIKTYLDSLVPATLAEVQVDDFRVGIFDREIGAYPVAILTTPSIEGDYLTNKENVRTHMFEIVVIQKGENISSATDIENLIEILMDKFDNNFTLAGKADAGVEPSSSTPAAYTSKGKNFITFSIFLKAKAIKALT